MNIFKDLESLRDAEDFFRYFNLEYDENILNPYRLHIMKKFSECIHKAMQHEDAPQDTIYENIRECLKQAYNSFLTTSPIEQRLFKVHKEAVKNFFINIEVKKDENA
ncbi:nitrogen fixation protein NifW [Thermocrinis albus DSM 14484]|uniref:Nitrogenase-stabilizing/protective protein NifW n=1 Tax=Thermocrinis albus (strain DSM 14484 / JCM 11386 / HI 11/12) TaxID=638303 RepID=D3SPG3_THEAH|nr:nitrogenase-stabilizing/protective protein NifW [Thermocrinis albus]ADC89050.1 nitrogen fixation protein NifW [Thermocrinis albus DSM 14484]